MASLEERIAALTVALEANTAALLRAPGVTHEVVIAATPTTTQIAPTTTQIAPTTTQIAPTTAATVTPTVPAVPSIAAVPVPPTAPEALPDTSLPVHAGFGQPAPSVPPLVPIAALPTAPLAATGSTVATGERDSAGIPWDGRIHAETKTKVSDGTWRTRRGVDKALVESVMAELRGAVAAPAPTALLIPTVPVVPSLPTPTVVSAHDNIPWPPAGVPPAPPVAAPMVFADFIAKLTPMIVAGTITLAQADEACRKVGVISVPALAARNDLVPQVAAALNIV